MITYIQGDLLSVTEGYIVHGCNAQGVMNSGVARQIRRKYPEAYLDYLISYSEGLGSISLVKVTDKLTIINAITQEYYGREKNRVYISYEAVTNCLIDLKVKIPGLSCVNMPKIGAGLGGGDWSIITTYLDMYLPDVQCNVWYL